MYKRFWPAKLQPVLSQRIAGRRLRENRSFSANEMRFQVYPRFFPFAMLTIMNYGKRFLKVAEFEDLTTHNLVQIESDSLIDPCLPESKEDS